MSSIDDLKRAAAEAALAELPEAGVIGLGTGSTVRFFIEGVGRLVASGRKLVGVPTSEASRTLATSLGIPLLDDAGPWPIEVTVDGADELAPDLSAIKGGGGAHTREKLVAQASKRLVLVVDAAKCVPQLGTGWAVPLEVLPFGHRATLHALERLGTPEIRQRAGAPWRTDAGNLVVDLKCGPIADPAALAAALDGLTGVVEHGLFVRMASVAFIAGGPAGIERRTAPSRP